MDTVAVFGTFDTKKEPFEYLIAELKTLGIGTITIDLGTRSGDQRFADYNPIDVAAAANTQLTEISSLEYTKALEIMGLGAAKLIRQLCDRGDIQGAISMGGGQGSFLAGIVMRDLPIGFPKVILSTAATRPSAHFIGINDTMIMNSLADIAGRNSLLDMTIRKAAHTMAGLLTTDRMLPSELGKKRVAITMWGVTSPCVEQIRANLEKSGYEVYIFHANSVGGPTMESLISNGFFSAVADITLNELTSGRIAGEYKNETRLKSAGIMGIPQVVAPGGVDMVNVGIKYPGAPIPEIFKGRKLYAHNPSVVFARSTPKENRKFAEDISELLNQSKGSVHLLLPLKGTSTVDSENGPFWEPETDKVLFESLKELCQPRVKIVEINCNINDPIFANAAAEILRNELSK